MLELKNVQVTYHNNPVLHNVSAQAATGTFVIIIGTNGAGKTTLFDTISGKKKPDSGSVILDNTDISNFQEKDRSSLISRLFQQPHLNCVSSMTVAQNLAMAHYKNNMISIANGMNNLTESQLNNLLAPLGVKSAELIATPMGALSGGQRQLISFIMATIVPPRLLLLDEPTAALDPAAATKLLTVAHDYIKQHGITTLMITHDPYIALSLADEIWVLEKGTITRTFKGEEKKLINPDNLIGHIDYKKLREN